MIDAYCISDPLSPCHVGEYPDVGSAVDSLRDLWMEEPDGEQVFALYLRGVTGERPVLAGVLSRLDAGDPELCRVYWALTGDVEVWRCHYVVGACAEMGPGEWYVRTEVTREVG